MTRLWLTLSLLLVLASCGPDPATPQQDMSTGTQDMADASADVTPDVTTPALEHPPESTLYERAGGCVAVGVEDEAGEVTWLRASSDTFVWGEREGASRFYLKASALGTYLLYDEEGSYLVGGASLSRLGTLESDITRVEEGYVSGAEWQLEFSERQSMRHQLRSRREGQWLAAGGLEADVQRAGVVVLEQETGCLEHPEMELGATGEVATTTHEDGALYGFVDAHSHILSSTGFGGGGIIHGQAFHRLGVTHAMGSCEMFHGPEGRADFLGSKRSEMLTDTDLLDLLTTGLLKEPEHETDGWPTFSGWPTHESKTHQTQYYRQLERAWMGGLRLMVQHAVSNEAFCEIMANTEFQPVRWGCADMENIDRQIDRVREMERYIDAQSGGPGKGWFRVVETPAQAREVIGQGKLAIVLGIEVPHLFECRLTPKEGSPVCDEAYIESQLDAYHAKGVRVLFPNHKYDNAFTPGDGHKGIVELGNFVATGHWSNFVEDCPQVDSAFDKGNVQFGGLNMPREDYATPAPNELITITPRVLRELFPYLMNLREPPLEGDYCQKTGLTQAGRTLIQGIMKRGMLPEIDHLPRRSYLDVFAMLETQGYPAVGTHGNTNSGKLYALGGMSTSGFGRCASAEDPGGISRRFAQRRALIEAAGGYPAEGFGFDLNGLAGVPRPRFGDQARCSQTQENRVEYPFESQAGDVTFLEPRMGDRTLDFNEEGMIHIGLVPELIEDARRAGAPAEDLEMLFRSAEGYIRMWERAEARSSEMK